MIYFNASIKFLLRVLNIYNICVRQQQPHMVSSVTFVTCMLDMALVDPPLLCVYVY